MPWNGRFRSDWWVLQLGSDDHTYISWAARRVTDGGLG